MRKNELEDTSGVQKFELSAEEYSKKTGTVQDFMRRNKMGKYNPEEVARLDAEKAAQAETEKEMVRKNIYKVELYSPPFLSDS